MENNNPSPTTSPQFGCFYRWPGSSRWTFDRGAMPGEPFAFLDGDQDSAMAAIFELQSPGKATVFEVRGTEGHVICRGEFPSCVAMAAERRIDNSVHLKRVLDARDYELAQAAFTNRESIDKPRIGDYVSFATGELERLSHDWDDGFQTSPTGAFFLSASGRGSLSCGGLNPLVPLKALEMTHATLPGDFWFFHHGQAGAGRGVHFQIVCRVYKATTAYSGFLGSDFGSSKIEILKADLSLQLNSAVSK